MVTFIHVFNIPLLHTTLSDGHGRDGCGFFFFFFVFYCNVFFIYLFYFYNFMSKVNKHIFSAGHHEFHIALFI